MPPVRRVILLLVVALVWPLGFSRKKNHEREHLYD